MFSSLITSVLLSRFTYVQPYIHFLSSLSVQEGWRLSQYALRERQRTPLLTHKHSHRGRTICKEESLCDLSDGYYNCILNHSLRRIVTFHFDWHVKDGVVFVVTHFAVIAKLQLLQIWMLHLDISITFWLIAQSWFTLSWFFCLFS